MVIGLRFNQRDKDTLVELLGRAMRLELGQQAVSLWKAAATASERNEALELHCTDVEEARQVAGAFTQYGIEAPTIELPTALN